MYQTLACCPRCGHLVLFEHEHHGPAVWAATHEPEALCYSCGRAFVFRQRISMCEVPELERPDYLSSAERERIHQLFERGHEIADDDDSYEPEPLI